ncbi:unnamed protein product [Mytilus coruscus]|uniref:RING-type domain-containing protein n=1 Tax=Mytilus coruscus TaxID=42192 RepID=A0A6J8CDV1_MYTCO|nr:unnamed protein product [Mytilus coruscus]
MDEEHRLTMAALPALMQTPPDVSQIYMGSVQGTNILLDRTILIKFNTHEANVPDIIAKFSDAVYEEQEDIEVFVLTDTKSNSRYRGNKRTTDPDDKKRKLDDIEDKLTDIVNAGKKLKAISDDYCTVVRSAGRGCKNSFTCLICKDLLKEPMFAKYCSTIVGCKVCVEEWLRNSTQCHKCRSRGAKDKVFPIVGINNGLEVLQAIVSE